MVKKITPILLLMTMVVLLTLTTYAAGKDAIYTTTTEPTKQFLATITRPEVYNETTYQKIYLVCGSTEERVIRFESLVFDLRSGYYVPLELATGGNTWFMDGPGVFAEQLVLPKNGVNLVRIAAYYDNGEMLVLNKNLQISDFAITLMEKNERTSFVIGLQRLANMFSQLFR